MVKLSKAMIMVMAVSLAACTQPITREEIGGQTHPITLPTSIETLASNAPIWKVGDSWHYSDGYELKVSSVAGNDTTFDRSDMPGDWVVRRGLFKIRSKQRDVLREVVYRTHDPVELFPLAVGKQVVFLEEYLRAGELIRHNTSWTVEGQESIQVPAGTFNCWILVMRTRGLQSNWTGSERWWYSPTVKHYVRMEYRYGTQPPGSRVLMSYHLTSLENP
jgi:hypothetical protein